MYRKPLGRRREANNYDRVSLVLQLIQVIPMFIGLAGMFPANVWLARLIVGTLLAGVVALTVFLPRCLARYPAACGLEKSTGKYAGDVISTRRRRYRARRGRTRPTRSARTSARTRHVPPTRSRVRRRPFHGRDRPRPSRPPSLSTYRLVGTIRPRG